MNLILDLLGVLVKVGIIFEVGSGISWDIIIDIGSDVDSDISLAVGGDAVAIEVWDGINFGVGINVDGITVEFTNNVLQYFYSLLMKETLKWFFSCMYVR